jgi:uncharacterized cupin superfamily protein
MPDITIVKTDDCATSHGGAMKLVRDGLGVESFGMQVIDLPPNIDLYPEHDHSEEGQEEVYTVLRGACTLIVDGEEHRLEPDMFARVGPSETRKIVTGDQPVRVLALGAVPGEAYEVSDSTRAQPQNV